MTSETYQDSSYDRKGQKRPSRPKLLKLTDVSMPHRNRKKTKTKVKERSQSNVRDRIYDDPAYTEDISHLAIPLRRNSGPDKIEGGSLTHKRKTGGHKDSQYSKRSESGGYQQDESSSSDNMPPDPGKHKRGQSLERANIIERSPKKREKRDRSAKQKRNLSLDNALSNSLRRSLEKSESSLKTASFERQKSKQKSVQRQNASESWSSCLAATSDSSKATENEESYAGRKEQSKMQIGKRFLKGEIGIKSFNYYLLKEGLKSSKKFVDKQRNSLTKGDAKKLHSRSEENIYEEIFFVDKNSDNEEHSKYPDCELCMQQCTKENCEYCLADLKSRQYFGSLGRNEKHHSTLSSHLTGEIPAPTAAHILQYQSYNPNNPGVYKIETTPVAFTSDYNPIHQLQLENQKQLPPRRFSRTASQIGGTRINTKSSSSSDSLHHKYAREQSLQELYEYNHPVIYGAPQPLAPYDQKIYKSDSKVSIISEYSIRSESSNRNFRCGEVSDSSLGDSMFSYSTQRRYFGSSESCRFAFECRRCSLDGEKCSFSDTCRYECRNCDCSSSYFSSDFDEYSRKTSTGHSNNSQKSYDCYNDSIDVKQNKYAQDFIKHVSDVKRSIYQAELQHGPTTMVGKPDAYGTIPPPKQMEMKKSMNHHSVRQYHQPPPSRANSSPFKIAPHPPPTPYPTQMMKDVNANRDNKGPSGNNARMSVSQTMDNENSIKIPSTAATTEIDKSQKFSEAKYALQTTIQQRTSDSGKQDKKDSLERSSQRKQTGAIPKLSSSSTSPHQSHRSQKTPTTNKDNVQRISVPGSKSPHSSPRHTTRTLSKDSNVPSERPAIIDHHIASEPKKLITMSSSTKPAAIEDIQQRNPAKEQLPVQDNHKSRKVHLDAAARTAQNGQKEDSMPAATDCNNDNNGNSGGKDTARPEPKPKDQNTPQVTRKVHTEQTKVKTTCFKSTDWSDYDDEDDDVFLDANTDDTTTTVGARQRCLAVPATPITPCTSELPETGSKSPPPPGGRDTLTVPTTTTTTTAPQPTPSSPKMQTKVPAPAAPKEDCAESAKGGQTTSATKGKPAPTTDSEMLTKATANGGGSQQQPQQQHPPKAPTTVLSDTAAKAPVQQKTPQSSELSMKAKQQIVESVTVKQVPQKPDAGRGDDKEKSQSSTAALATSTTLVEAPQRSKAEPGETPASSINTGETANEETTSATTAANAGAGGATSAEEISRESDAAGATLNRSQNDTQKPQKDNQEETVCLENSEATSTDDSKLTKNSTKSSNDLSSVDKIDISDLPLPELPPKKRRNRDKTAITKYNENLARDRNRTAEHLREFQPNRQNQYIAKRRESLELSNRHFSEKLEARKMHYHNLGHITATQNNSIKPTYLFGENRTSSNKKNITDEIFLNKSGWVQVNSKRINDENSANSHNRKSNSIRLENQNGSLKNSIRVIQLENARDKPVYAVPRMPNSKIEELISRSEARRSNNTSRGLMRPGYKILDPQIASILNERPGFLPVRTFMDNESPPPITPILSPPPAFQDSKTKYKHTNINGSVKVQINPNQYDQKTNKGMVFSRSFEYDRKPADYAETFSKSFDSNLSEPPKPVKRDRSPNFSTLTGNSPNYLTKKENRSRDNSPKYQQIGSTYLKQNEALAYNNPRKLDKVIRTSLDRNDRSRRAQFSRINTNLGNSRFRSFDTNISHRLNSCDSGARSDLSNDEVDDEDDNSTEFLSASYQSQPIFLQPKQRSLTPEKYDTHSAQNSLRKQRSLTPESRSLTPEDRRKKGSQASLSSRPNSGSRNNTLERKPKYEDKSHSPSRSSSSSSYSGREHDVATPHRRSATRNSKTPEEHRIRRSRSLQLSEKSPSRTTQSHKMVVCLGPPATVTNQQTYHQPVRNFPPTIRPNQIVSEQVANSRNMRSDIDKSRSFDLDYGPSFSNQPVPARLDFDKSRSFDEDYREQSNNMRYLTDTGVMREDRNILKPNLQRTTPAPRQTSPQNYGTRLCDHELTYDMLRRTLDRSPIMDFSRDYDVPRPMKGREVMNVGGSELNFLNERIYDHGMKVRNSMPAENSYIDRLKSRDNMTPESELKSMRESLASMNDERMRSGVGDYIYRQPMKGQQQQQLLQHQQQQRSMLDRSHQSFTGSSAPTRGSCTASSCDFWPHCGLTNLNTNKNTSVDHPNISSAASTSDPAKKDAASDDEEDDEGYIIVREGVKKQKSSGGANTTGFSGKRVGSRSKYNRKSYSLQETGKTSRTDSEGRIRSKPPIYVNSAAAAAAGKSTSASASVVFLGEREMPITRERDLPTSPTTTPSQSSPGNNGKLSDKQNRLGTGLSGSGDSRFLRPTGLRSKAGTPNNIRLYRKQRSLSLPNVFLQIQFSSATSTDDAIRPDPFSPNLPNQMRAVSSPSLSENPSEIISQTQQNRCSRQNEAAVSDIPYSASQNYAGVLQKFKKTFSQFKGTGKQQPQIIQPPSIEIESGKYRFGPLIWRSSKERRKTKYNRRDKCNSGDSGIQIELENEEIFTQDGLDSIETSPTLLNSRVRRANSAKVTNSMTSSLSAKAKALKKVESYENKLTATPLPTRSLSQPSGLDRMARADIDESDTDSVSSHPDLHEGQRSIYAEVLYPFTPAGPQELALEKGSLVEILRKDIGPWWYGRIKHDAVIAKIVEPQQGWFPKEFVRVIPPFFGIEPDDGKQLSINKNNTLEFKSCDSRMSNTTTILPVNSIEAPAKSMLSSPSQQNQHHSTESLRNSVIKELLETEINYVKLLSSLCLGYLREMRKRIDIFPTESLNLIFSNIESVWRFQQSFLDALRKGIENRRIAQVFLDHQSGFMVYSNYCNSYPRALMELESYSSSKEAKCVLENCRIAENLPELPLSAHLLAPIQRICRYPLHLSELVKHTPSRQILSGLDENVTSHDIGDCKETLEIALTAMKKVTETVNEGKRHSEHLTRFQASFENFQGPPIAFHSTRFFMQTDATRVSPNLWNNTYTLFLFDHQLIYCKKDILKRNHYIYKGRIFLDNCRILNLPDGKLFGVTLKNALRMYCESRNKWFDFCFRSASRKLRFLSTLAIERQFCGTNLFVSELGGEDDENLSDREYHSDYDTPTNTINRNMSAENFYNMNLNWRESVYDVEKLPESPAKMQKYSDTLPKKSRKTTAKEGYEYSTGSLGRRKIGSWFRKAKSTNSTPTQSPTHHSVAFNSDSSSQSSPALGYKPNKSKVKEIPS